MTSATVDNALSSLGGKAPHNAVRRADPVRGTLGGPLKRLLPLLLLSCANGSPDKSGPGSDSNTETDVELICPTVSITVPFAAADVPVGVLISKPADLGTARRLVMRPLQLDGSGTMTLSVEGPYLLSDADGLPLQDPTVELPTTVLVAARSPGGGTFTAAAEGCDGATVELISVRPPVMAGRSLPAPHTFEPSRLFRSDEQIQVALDPVEHAGRVGSSADLYMVRHRTPEQWLADPELVDGSDGPESHEVQPGGRSDNLWLATAASLRVEGLVDAWDLVLDFGQDGRLDPGDLIDGFGTGPAFSVAGDLSAPGPHAVVTEDLDEGQWLEQRLFAPDDLQSMEPAPLVVISHGNGHDFRWYDHIGEHLASWGFVVMSHKNNTEPGIQAASKTTLDNVDHLLGSLPGRLGGRLDGRVDSTRIGWIGHSRGGEGIVRAYHRLFEGSYGVDNYGVDDIQVLLSIAPTVFQGLRGARPSLPHRLPLHLMLGGADGDVTGGADCLICQSLRLAGAAEGAMGVTYFHGASHNVFHDGGGFDDGVGPQRLSRRELHPALKSYALALMSWRLNDQSALHEVFSRSADVRRPQGVSDELTIASTWREDLGGEVRVVDDFQDEDASTNSLGGAITSAEVFTWEGKLDDGNRRFSHDEADPANGLTWAAADGWERGLVLGWTADGFYETALPEGERNAWIFDALSLRIAAATRHPDTTSEPLTLTVELQDEDGTVSALSTDPYGHPTFPYARGGLGPGSGWGNEFNTLRLPLVAFTESVPELDLRRLVAIRLRVGPSWGAARARVVVDELYLTRM